MRVAISVSPVDHDNCCDVLEALAEGIVLANMVEIGTEDDDAAFPCCVKCGGFKIMPERAEIDCARKIVERGGGNAIALVCYQVAQRRREGGDPKCDVVIEHVERNGVKVQGKYHPKIRTPDRDKPNEDLFIDPLEGLEVEGDCGCGEKST